MGLIEFGLLIFLILTIGHYIVAWSIYLEKKFELVCKMLIFFILFNFISLYSVLFVVQPSQQMALSYSLIILVGLWSSAEILVLGPHLFTWIWVRAVIGLFNIPLSICQGGWREIQSKSGDSLSLLGAQNRPEQGYQYHFTDVTKAVGKQTQQLPTLLRQQHWELLRSCWRWCVNGCNNSQ